MIVPSSGQETNQGGGFLFGLFVHALHTVIVARDGKLIANLEGTQRTARQFADLHHNSSGSRPDLSHRSAVRAGYD
jgi:hypothetical protein